MKSHKKSPVVEGRRWLLWWKCADLIQYCRFCLETHLVWWSRIFECSHLTPLGFKWFQLEEASCTTRFAFDAKIPLSLSFYMYHLILQQYSGTVLKVCSLPFVVLQILAGGGEEEKEYVYSFAPSQPPDKSRNCKPFFRVMEFGEDWQCNSGKLRTSKYWDLFEFAPKRMENIWAVYITSGQVWGEAARLS